MAMAWSSGMDVDDQRPSSSTRGRDTRHDERQGDNATEGHTHSASTHATTETNVNPGHRRGSTGSFNRQARNVSDISQVEEAGEMAELRRQRAREGILQKREILLASKRQHEQNFAAAAAGTQEVERSPQDGGNGESIEASSRRTSLLSDVDQVIDDVGRMRLADGPVHELETPGINTVDASSSQAQTLSVDSQAQARTPSPTHRYIDPMTFDESASLVDFSSISVWANSEPSIPGSKNIDDHTERSSTLSEGGIGSFSDDAFETSNSHNSTETVNHSPAATPVLSSPQSPVQDNVGQSEFTVGRPGAQNDEHVIPSNHQLDHSALSSVLLEEQETGTFWQTPFEDSRYQTSSTPTDPDAASTTSTASIAANTRHSNHTPAGSQRALSDSDGSLVDIGANSDDGSSDGMHAVYTPSEISSNWSDLANDVSHSHLGSPHPLDEP